METFGEYYPELRKHQSKIHEIISEEEQAFSTMLSRGIKYFTELQENLQAQGETTIRGKDAFFLYDTMGFPLDLTQQMATEAGLTLDTDGFAREMDAQKQRSRIAKRTNAEDDDDIPRLELIAEQTAWLSSQNIAMTDDTAKYLWDVETDAQVKAIYGVDGNFFDDSVPAKEGDVVGLILDKSSFYAEAGGQVADTGFIDIVNDSSGDIEASLEVKTVQTFGGFLVHTGIVRKGKIGVGNVVRCRVNYNRRRDIAPNHTMTHVLNAALRSVLGDGVEQRGSLCNEDKLRFDFTYKKAMSIEQLRQTEEFVQRVICNKEAVSSKVIPLAEAKTIDGVRAVFGETYPDPVRVVSVGDDTSIEFCGGTHLSNSAEAEAFALVEESAVAKGIRRISGVTKVAAKKAIEEGSKFTGLVASLEEKSSGVGVMEELDKVAGALRKDLDAAFLSASLKAELRARIEALQKRGAEAKKIQLQQRTDKCLNNVKEQIQAAAVSGKNALVVYTDICADAKASQRIINAVKELAPNMAFMGVSEEDPGSGGKLICYAVVPDCMVAQGFRADQWVQAALATCGGRGGGKANNAQGQAKECKDIDQVLSEGNAYINMNAVVQ